MFFLSQSVAKFFGCAQSTFFPFHLGVNVKSDKQLTCETFYTVDAKFIFFRRKPGVDEPVGLNPKVSKELKFSYFSNIFFSDSL